MLEKMTHQEQLEAIELEFMEARENGEKSTLLDFCVRYPDFRMELVDFVLLYVPVENAVARMSDEETEEQRAMSERAIRRALEQAGIRPPASDRLPATEK